MYKTRFEETEIGNNYDMTLLVVRIEERTTKKGDPYCRLTLSDGKTQQEANLFNNNTRESLKLQGVTEEKPVDVRLKCTEFQNQKNYTVDSINPARLTDEEKAALIKMPPLPRQQMLLDMIRIVLDSSGRQYDKDNVIIPEDDYSLTALTVRLISKNSKAFSSSSAAKSMHHNLIGGLLYHTYRMVKAAYSVCDIYTMLNRELLVCGTALHDIGKIEELSTSEGSSLRASFVETIQFNFELDNEQDKEYIEHQKRNVNVRDSIDKQSCDNKQNRRNVSRPNQALRAKILHKFVFDFLF